MSDKPQQASGDSPGPVIPPFQDKDAGAGGFKSVLQLFLVPLMIVVVAGGIFFTMNMLIGGEPSPSDILEDVASGDSRRRGQAAFRLATRLRANPEILEEPAFRDRLLRVYESTNADDDVSMRRYLTQVLSQAAFPEATPALIQATGDKDPETRLYAVVALGSSGDLAAYDRLSELTQDGDAGVRSVSCAALGALGDARAVAILSAKLNDASIEVSWNAANALVHLGSGAGDAVLRQMLDERYLDGIAGLSADQRVQAMFTAIDALARLERLQPDASRAALLRRIADEAEIESVRGAAMAALEEEDGS